MKNSNHFIPVVAPLNSFHTNIPQIAATKGAALLSPYEIADPAALTAINERAFPEDQIIPPATPHVWFFILPEKYCFMLTDPPSMLLRIKKGLKIIVLIKAPIEKKTTAV